MDDFGTTAGATGSPVPDQLRSLFNRPGDVRVQELPCALPGPASLAVHFGAGTRTVPHQHHSGQHLVFTEGTGVVADANGVHVVQAGDVASNGRRPPGLGRHVPTGPRCMSRLSPQPLDKRGLMNRFLGPLARRVDTPWKIYPIGFLFGLGFDTATEIALLVLAGTAVAGVRGDLDRCPVHLAFRPDRAEVGVRPRGQPRPGGLGLLASCTLAVPPVTRLPSGPQATKKHLVTGESSGDCSKTVITAQI